MKKLFLTLTALYAMSTAAWAEYDGYTGGLSQGAVLEWKLPHEGGTMIIFGEDYNPMNDFILGDATFGTPWSRDNDLAEKIQAINMQKGINIGKYAFSNLPNLESISIHGVGTNTKALFCIGNYAFANSPKFTTINSETLSELRYIGAEAFKGTAIKSFTIDKPVGGNLPAYLTTEQGYGIDLNREHCYIGANAFAACDHLTTLYMKDDTPFADTYNNFLNDHTYLVVDNADVAATFRAAWPEIAGQVIYMAQSVTFENETFKDICISHWDTNGDGELSYEEAFAVTTFGDAFKGNTSLKEITLSDLTPFINVTIIGSGTFEGCTALEKITFPPHIEDIADDAFTGCTSLKGIHFTAALPFKEEFTIQLNDRTHIIVPDAYLPTYDNTWTDKAGLIIGESHIPFQCPTTKSICITNWDTDKDGELSYAEAAAVTSIDYKFQNKSITSFDEFKYFTNVKKLNYKEVNNGNWPYDRQGTFFGCSKLKSIIIPANVTSITYNVFEGCSSLTRLVFEDGSSTLWMGYRFYHKDANCYGQFNNSPIEYLYLGRNISKYDSNDITLNPFNTSKLSVIEIGNTVNSIDYDLSRDALQEIRIHDLKAFCNINMGGRRFRNCNLVLGNKPITNLTLPELTTLRKYAFAGFNLESVIIPDGITSIPIGAFGGCKKLCSVTIPNSVTSIEEGAFGNCSSLTAINIPESVTTIGKTAFAHCLCLSPFTVPNTVTSVGYNAFTGVPIVIFDSTTPITYDNFSTDIAVYVVPDDAVSTYKEAWVDVPHRVVGKSYLEWQEVTCEAQPTLPHLTEMIGAGNEGNIIRLRIKGSINSYDMMVMRNKMVNLRELDLTNATIVANTYNYGTGVSENNVYPDFLKGKYITKLMLPTSITKIGGSALRDCKYLKSITIPSNVETVGGYAFYDCSILNIVDIPENSQLSAIGSYAFAYSYNSTEKRMLDFTQAQQLQTIGSYAFFRSGFASIQLPSSLQTIEESAFRYCSSLKSIATSAKIGNYAFSDCTALTHVIANSDIGNYAFSGCTSLSKVTLEEGTTSIGKNAFYNCTSLKDVTLPSSLNTIGTYAFYSCGFNSIELPEALTTIESYAFKYSKLQSIELPDALTTLGTYVFDNCRSLERAEIGMNITSVPQYLFSGCSKLKNVKLSPKTRTIQSYAFQNCSELEEIHLPPYLTTIQANAFSGCSKLKNIYAYMPDVPTISVTTFSNYQTSNLYAPAFLWSAYYVDQGWNQFLNVLKCDLRPGDYEAFYTNKDLYFKEGEERITQDRPIVELGNQGAIIVEGAVQEFTSVDMLRGTTSSSLIGDGNITMDELRVKIEVNANRWYFLCFPYDVEIDGCEYPDKYAWRYYDGATRAANGSGGWQKIEGNTLKAGVGYIFQSNTAGNLIVKFADPEFGGDRPTTLTAYNSTNAANASWNFVGNPYASYYNVEAEDFTSPITVWNGSTYVAYRPGDDDYHLQPYEAFFVQKTEDASAVNFDADRRETYTMSKAVAASQARARRERGITPERLIVNLTISDNDTAAIDRTRLVMNAKASRSYEMACDASKFISDDAAAQLYTLEGNVKMAINERPGDGEVRLGYIATKAGTLRLEAQRMDMPMEIIDTETDRTFDLSQGAYEFTTKAGTFDNRFVVRASRAATEIMNLTAATGVAIGMQEGGLSIGGAEGKNVSIYAANGALVAERSGNGYVALTAGTYVVKVDGHSAKMYVK